MAGLRELRKRLASIRTTGQLTGAMRSAAAAKYARLHAAVQAYQPYCSACADLLGLLDGTGTGRQAALQADAPECLVLLTGNRGLCGGFHTELLRFFSERYAASEPVPAVVACGRAAAACCRDKGIAIAASFSVSDIPTYEEAHALSTYLREQYRTGAVGSVTFVCQKFFNMLKQTPACRRLLPAAEADASREDAGAEALLLPDPDTLREQLDTACLDAEVYDCLLTSALGVQAATLIAMRSAYDHATESAEKLELAINRRRQAEVTSSVMETSSEIF